MGESVRLFVSGDKIADMEYVCCAMRLVGRRWITQPLPPRKAARNPTRDAISSWPLSRRVPA
jgi:hypothetical protein